MVVASARETLLLLVLLAVPAWAEDWSVNGKDYHNVVVGQVDADCVHVTYDGGLGRIALADLPPDLQKRFNYDPAKAKEAAQAEAEKEAESDRQYAVDVQKQAQQERKADQQAQQQKIVESAKPFRIRVLQVLPDGLLANPYVAVEHFPSAFNGNQSGITYELSDNVIFIQCAPLNTIDGQDGMVKAFQSGTYAYTDTMGARRTVPKYIGIPTP